MFFISVVYALISSNQNALYESMVSGTQASLDLILSTCGMLCFWTGIVAIARECSVNTFFARIMSPILKRIFTKTPQNSKGFELISLNISANLLGLGNAATPLGLSAMEELQKLNDNPLIPSDDMINFVVMNTASLQLIPTTLVTYRSTYGSVSPFEIIPCIWISSLAALIVGITLAKTLRTNRSK